MRARLFLICFGLIAVACEDRGLPGFALGEGYDDRIDAALDSGVPLDAAPTSPDAQPISDASGPISDAADAAPADDAGGAAVGDP